MHPRAIEFLREARDRYSFTPAVQEFPEGTKTAADAAAAIGCSVGQIAASLVFDTDSGPAVVVTSGANRAAPSAVATALGVDSASLADADRVKATVGWAIGGVPPFCHATTVPVVVDEALLDYDTVWAAAGTPEAVFPIAPERLVEIADGRTAPVTA